jgi:regulator of sigma E protease
MSGQRPRSEQQDCPMELANLVIMPFAIGASVIVPYLVALIVIVFVHEFGHFIVARWCGVRVEAFSIGFGREITGWTDRKGTRWKIAWIPLGGYVKFAGDANAASMPGPQDQPLEPGTFHAAALWRRALIVAAGPAVNFLLAIVIFAAAFMVIGEPKIEPRVGEVMAGSAAEKAGIQVGDLIVAVNGSHIDNFVDLQEAIVTKADEPVTITINRADRVFDVVATPTMTEVNDDFGGKFRKGLLGVAAGKIGDPVSYQRYGPIQAVEKGTQRTWFIVSSTFKYLSKLLAGQEKADQLHGPIGTAGYASQAAEAGFFPFISIIALMSASIGLINLFPIPMLDGGHLVFYAIEALRGRPLGRKAQEWGFRVGFSLIIMLMMLGTWNDISSHVSRFFGS